MSNSNEAYRYTECGLDNVFIEGLDVVTDDHGEEVYGIPNILTLHKMIAEAIITNATGMSGKELRFLRTEMGYTQEQLADLLQIERITMGRWERGDKAVNANAETVIRLLAAEKLEIGLDISVEKMTKSSVWSSELTEIRIDGSDPENYRPIAHAA